MSNIGIAWDYYKVKAKKSTLHSSSGHKEECSKSARCYTKKHRSPILNARFNFDEFYRRITSKSAQKSQAEKPVSLRKQDRKLSEILSPELINHVKNKLDEELGDETQEYLDQLKEMCTQVLEKLNEPY